MFDLFVLLLRDALDLKGPTTGITRLGEQVYHDPSEPIVDPETGKLLTSRPTAFGKYLNSKV